MFAQSPNPPQLQSPNTSQGKIWGSLISCMMLGHVKNSTT
jgi:hypothetical protein